MNSVYTSEIAGFATWRIPNWSAIETSGSPEKARSIGP
jgi:hypothetical protein